MAKAGRFAVMYVCSADTPGVRIILNETDTI